MRTNRKDNKANDNTSIEPYTSKDASKDVKSFMEKIMGEVSKSSAMKQIIIGSTSGWYIQNSVIYKYCLCIYVHILYF